MTDLKNHYRINLLYLSRSDDGESFSALKNDPEDKTYLPLGCEFNIEQSSDIKNGIQAVKTGRVDAVLLDMEPDAEKLITDIKSLGIEKYPAIFAVFSNNPDSVAKDKVLMAGYTDFFVKPLSLIEIAARIKVHLNNRDLEKSGQWHEEKLARAKAEIEKLENNMASVKEELFDERDVLNNSLKQINLMTKERDKLKKEIEAADRELVSNLEGFTELLCSMIESRVEENRGHSIRVTEICMCVAEEMKLSKIEKDQLRKAAMLHEAGKLLISDSILKKGEDELEDNEKDFFRHYPEKGARLLAMCSGFDKIVDIIKYQNEKVDGTGTPEGLKRKQIPIQSRILAGANTFDELRCKVEISSLKKLLESLENKIGSSLDPLVVNCLEKYAVTRLAPEFEKVRGIGIHQLSKGMRLGTALFTASGTKLFSADTLLDEESIEKIIKYNKEYPVDETIYIKA